MPADWKLVKMLRSFTKYIFSPFHFVLFLIISKKNEDI